MSSSAIRRLVSRFGFLPRVAALVVVAARLCAAQQPPAAAAFVGRNIEDVRITIEGQPTSDRSLFDVLETRRGVPLSVAAVRETITHLYSLGRFEDVRVDATEYDNGVVLRYDVIPIHSVSKVEFRGDLGLSDGTLRNRMAERFGATPRLGRVTEVADALVQLYHEHGYLRAAVRPAPPVVAHDPDRATLVFDVNAGQRARIASVKVSGRTLEPAVTIPARLGVATGAWYDPGDLQQRLDAFRASMRKQGHYLASASEQPQVSPDGSEVALTINVDAGPLVAVKLEGDPLPKAKIAELVPIEREGSVDPDLIEDSARRIQDYFQQQGYWKAQVQSAETEREDVLTVLFKVSRGRLYHVGPEGIEVTGNRSITLDRIKGVAAIGDALQKLSPGDVYVASRLAAVTGAIEDVYQRDGFPDVKVASAANEVGPGLVKPVIVVTEGPRVAIGKVTIAGNRAIKTEDLLPEIKSTSGSPFYGPAVADDRDRLRERYLNDGYASARVTIEPKMGPDRKLADLAFTIQEGPQTIVDHILIVGNTRTDPRVIERELLLQPGHPLGLQALVDSRQRLVALGLFRRVQINELAHESPSARDVVVTVEEALRTTIGFGGGAQIDRRLQPTGPGGEAREAFEFAPRGFFEVGRRNLGGRNRSINLYTRLSLRPNSDPNNPSTFGFAEYRVVGTYREPRAFHNYGDLTGTAAIEQGVRSTFNFARKGVNAELTHPVSKTLRSSLRYSFGTTRIFDENLTAQDAQTLVTVDRVFPRVRLSAVSGALARDTRDDLLNPQRGAFLSADLTLAARGMYSQVGFAKTFLQGFAYRAVGSRGVVLAGGVRLGLANAFLQTVQTTDPQTGAPVTTIVRDLPASERFFAGGDTTIRGYALDTVGAPKTISSQGFPIGGSALVILNAEVRAPIWRDLGGVLFADGGNVYARTGDVDLGEMRGAVGFGLRYRSPVGPIRIDLGFKTDRRVIAGRLEPRTAIHFSIGQAF